MDGAHKLDSHSVFQIRLSQCFVQIFFCILFDRSGFLGLAIPMLKKKQTGKGNKEGKTAQKSQ